MPANHLVLISVGNTRTRIATANMGKLEPSRVLLNAERAALFAAAQDAVTALPAGDAAVLLASVNDPVAEPLVEALAPLTGQAMGRPMIRIGRGMPVPIRTALTPPVTVGTDRLLNALAANGKSGEACVVIDAGTAITIDFVDKWGIFQGGCIAPGLGLMLKSLHEHTAALPLVAPPREPVLVGAGIAPLGRTTVEAMTRGCVAALQGMMRILVDRYAEFNGSYPRVIATGGDAALLAEGDEWNEVIHIVPDLILMGMLAAWTLTENPPSPEDGNEQPADDAADADDGDDGDHGSQD